MDEGRRLQSEPRRVIHFVRRDFAHRSIKSDAFAVTLDRAFLLYADGCASG
jgi:hypothetical protein